MNTVTMEFTEEQVLILLAAVDNVTTITIHDNIVPTLPRHTILMHKQMILQALKREVRKLERQQPTTTEN